ncbi:elongation factor P 5-aminopentanone reductase [Metabacillus litoralis]|jgi:3-oxoacyl-[acyl-carrier protein] reductase|uniref:elongation factor P 5-aminopentanone reductase n=1 Tax=Metabacillus litoralis TaxID=152268 RepID=UPI00204257E2|nr:SDR family oxidoreductase [Metabacillus litoralis]MCM3654019.1 SDR family oxidoreductase [Metabacillus litoralis]
MDKYALITGASGGVGSAIAKKLIEDGYHLYVHYHQNEQAMMELIRSISINKNIVIPIQADLTKQSGVQYLIDQIQMPIDLLVLNSGMSFYGLVTDMSDDDIDQMVNIHITSPFRLTQKLIPTMIRKRAGNIIVISSIWGITGASCEVLYSMVKGGQNSFVKALAKELAPSQIRVNAIAPGAIQTRMLSNFSTEELTELEEEIPLGRLGQPDEIANTVSFLASKQASYITGQVISVNGGWC